MKVNSGIRNGGVQTIGECMDKRENSDYVFPPPLYISAEKKLRMSQSRDACDSNMIETQP